MNVYVYTYIIRTGPLAQAKLAGELVNSSENVCCGTIVTRKLKQIVRSSCNYYGKYCTFFFQEIK